MKPRLILIACFLLMSLVATPGFVTQSYSREFPFGTAGLDVITFSQGVLDLSTENSLMKDVTCFVITGSSADDIVRASSATIPFAESSEIGTNSLVYPRNPQVNVAGIGVLDFGWELRQPGNDFYQTPISDPFPGQHEVIIGFRLGKAAGARFGWMRLHRESTLILARPHMDSELATPYTVADVNLNPFPGRRILAGLPPELPTLQTIPLPDGPGGPQLRVQWPDGFPGVRLQRAATLDSPIVWEDIETVGNSAVVQIRLFSRICG